MSKRHLTKQQRRRIQQNQEKARAEVTTQREADDYLSQNELGPEQDGRVIASYGAQVEVEAVETGSVHDGHDGTNHLHVHPSHRQNIRRCHLRANLPTIITGDKVTWQDGEPQGVVIAQHPRKTELCRPDNRGKLRPVASNIDRIAIVIAPYPEPHGNLIDRYLVAAEHQGITPMIILNKGDLIDDSNGDQLTNLLDRYIKLGYDCFLVSAHSGEGIEQLEDYLEEFTSVFVGQSGVGKSSLLNTLSPEVNTPVGALSEAKAKGTHTTTNSRLFHLPNGGDVIDSPGIREFGLWHLDPESIAEAFIEFRPFLGNCKFRDCKHQQEPGCELAKAVDDEQISQERFNSYWHMVNSLNQSQ